MRNERPAAPGMTGFPIADVRSLRVWLKSPW
jgi:hypothetical protein